jgi:hypothetical protein
VENRRLGMPFAVLSETALFGVYILVVTATMRGSGSLNLPRRRQHVLWGLVASLEADKRNARRPPKPGRGARGAWSRLCFVIDLM